MNSREIYVQRGDIVLLVKEQGKCTVTGELMGLIFPQPDEMFNATLILAGHRPELTGQEELDRFCKVNGLRYYFDFEHGNTSFTARES